VNNFWINARLQVLLSGELEVMNSNSAKEPKAQKLLMKSRKQGVAAEKDHFRNRSHQVRILRYRDR